MAFQDGFYKFASMYRIITLTVSFIGLIGVILVGYINDTFDVSWFLLLGAFCWNIIYIVVIKPRPSITAVTPPDTINHSDTTPPSVQ